ncbi:MAG: hypothetical protein E7263_09950 [Lachnospiraceae bacterium]|nr:hypothetical protein [Lachnospiraceae bacterium]
MKREKPRTKTEDNVIYMETSEETKEANDKKEQLTKNQKKASYFLLVLIIIAVLFVVSFLLNKQYKGYKVVDSNVTDYENTANFVEFISGLLKYTPDGVSYIDANGNTVWSAGVDMKQPVAVVSGRYVAIADLSGNTVGVFNDEGPVSTVTMPYTICDVDVANQGAFAVVLESEETNYINLYNKKGEIVYEIQTTIDKSGYPLDISISDDGKKLFTSYLNIENSLAENSLAAYNFGDVGQNSNADRMVGGYKFENEVIPKVEFIDNDTVVAFGTHTITVYAMKEKPTDKASIQLKEDIRSVFYNEKYIGIVQNCNGDDEHKYIVKVYNLNGNLEFDNYIDFDYNNIYAAEKEIIITGGTNCLIYRTNGSVKYEGIMSGNIMSMVPNSNNLEYVVVYDDLTETIKLKLGKTEQVAAPKEEE